MLKLLMPLLVAVLLIVLISVAWLLIQGGRREAHQHRLALAKVRQITDLAYFHDEISSGLAGAVIERTRGLDETTSTPELLRALDDVLDLARAHRTQEADLAAIVIDTVRTNELN